MKYFWLLMMLVALIFISLLPILLPSDTYNEAVKLMGTP